MSAGSLNLSQPTPVPIPSHGYNQSQNDPISTIRDDFSVLESTANSNVDKPCIPGSNPYSQVYQDTQYQPSNNNSYLNNFQISSNISPTSPSFPPGYPTPSRAQSYYNNNILSPSLRSSTDVPTTTTNTSYPQFYNTSQPNGMGSLMSHRASLNLSLGLNQNNHYPSSYYPYSFQHDMRRPLDSSFLPSPALRTPGYPRSNGFVSLPMLNNHMPNSMHHESINTMIPPMNTPMSGNDQIKFLSQNPQYLSGLAGQALGSSGKISRAIAAQLFARDEHTDRFPCTLCGQSFKRINGLKRHLMMHLHIKPYKCEMCGRGFCRIDVYKRHVNRAKCNKDTH